MKELVLLNIGFGLMFTSIACLSEQVEIPNSFVSGSKAYASEVNENFSVLEDESNSQDIRIQALESSASKKPLDQLICPGDQDFWFLQDSRLNDCVQSSNPTVIRSLTYTQVAEEGWVAVSLGGPFLFYMYE